MLTLTRHQMQTAMCVYSHMIDGSLVWVGICPVRDAYSAPDARNNSEWIKMTVNDTPVTVTVLHASENVNDCINFRYRMFKEQGVPVCNAKGTFYSNVLINVRCIETGEIFESQADCARTLGLNKSQLCNHLNRLPGYKSVKGRTFEKCRPASAPQPSGPVNTPINTPPVETN